MNQFGPTEDEQKKGYADFSECEKYMYTMISVEDAASKFDSMLFRSQFQGRLDELMVSIRQVEQACDEVRGSEKLRIIMAMILTLVNEINTGGDGNEAEGFTLDALLKLNEVCFGLHYPIATNKIPGQSLRQKDECSSLPCQTLEKK